jgi:hypothetical protein
MSADITNCEKILLMVDTNRKQRHCYYYGLPLIFVIVVRKLILNNKSFFI